MFRMLFTYAISQFGTRSGLVNLIRNTFRFRVGECWWLSFPLQARRWFPRLLRFNPATGFLSHRRACSSFSRKLESFPYSSNKAAALDDFFTSRGIIERARSIKESRKNEF
jgi:hypothetical protein